MTAGLCVSAGAAAAPKVILISLDGAEPQRVERYLNSGVLSRDEGLGILRAKGVSAQRNVTILPSLTAPSHIAIATGSYAGSTDVVANSFHLTSSRIGNGISGFAAPIGGYHHDPVAPAASAEPTAKPLWIAARAAGRKVAAATFPGADGIDVTASWAAGTPVLQPAAARTVDYTVPFGAFGGRSAQGFVLGAADFAAAPALTVEQLAAAGQASFSPVLQKVTSLEAFTLNTASVDLRVAALDTSDDATVNYDTLVFFDQAIGIAPGPFALPATGPAYVRAAQERSAPFYFEGTPNRIGAAFYVSRMAPDLSVVHVARYAANYIPRNAAVLADVDDANGSVGFWAPQPDYRIPERLSSGFTAFGDDELEAIYADQVRTFVDYQTRLLLRAIERMPDVDLLMGYIEQPDGSGHQFTLTDPRQATDPRDPDSIGDRQDPGKVSRYARLLELAYAEANRAIDRIIDAVGVDGQGRPNSNIIVVSDHGMAPFHTAVSIGNLLANAGVDTSHLRVATSGPVVNVYVDLLGRETEGAVSRTDFIVLQEQIAEALAAAADANPTYTRKKKPAPLFAEVRKRPLPRDIDDPSFGLARRGKDQAVDSGDVVAVLNLGYNFDGTQSPAVPRKGDAPSSAPVLSVPNFYGAHGYDPEDAEMAAIFYAAGPDIGRTRLRQIRNVDIAPTILSLLGVTPAATVQGVPIDLTPERR